MLDRVSRNGIEPRSNNGDAGQVPTRSEYTVPTLAGSDSYSFSRDLHSHMYAVKQT